MTFITMQWLKALEEAEGYKIEIFKETELLFDITEHRLVSPSKVSLSFPLKKHTCL